MKVESAAKTLFWTVPAVSAYLVGLPWLGISLDKWLRLSWRLPGWIDGIGWFLIGVSSIVAIVSAWLLILPGLATPNSVAPLEAPVAAKPHRRAPNFLVLCACLLGIGLAVILRSISILSLVLLLVVVGALYLGFVEVPRLTARFGSSYQGYMRLTKRWLPLMVAFAGLTPILAVGQVVVEPRIEPAQSVPTLMVQVRCKPGTSDLWRRSFEQEILPSIHEAIARGDGFTRFTYLEAALPGQPFDFVLLFEGKSFSQLDRRRPFPHYRVLFERIGPLRAQLVLKQMLDYEDGVAVTIVRRYEASP